MFRLLLTVSTLFIAGLLQANPEAKAEVFHDLNPEMRSLDMLIEQTQKNLEEQQKLKALLKDYHQNRENFSKGGQTKQQATALVKTANAILKIVHEEHLLHLCTPEFIEEITFFASIASKNSLTPHPIP